MASQTVPEKFADMPFPMYGLDLLRGFGLQRFNTTAVGNNVRGFEPLTGRGRGGSRPGLTHYAPIVPADPTKSLLIQHLNIIVDPQAPALPSTLGDGNGSGQPPALLGPTAVLDTSTPDELGPRTSGDYWVPNGGWGFMSTRKNSPKPQTKTAYMISVGILLQSSFQAGGSGQPNVTTGTGIGFLNGTSIAILSGIGPSWPSDPLTGGPQFYTANTNATTDLSSDTSGRIYNLSPPSIFTGYHDSITTFSQSLLVFGNPVGTGMNTISLSGNWSISNQNVGDDETYLQATISITKETSSDNGQTWKRHFIGSVSGIGLGHAGQTSGALNPVPPSPPSTLTFTFFL